MISTYTPLPLLTANPTEAPPPGADAARDDNAPTFQSRLDQQNDMYRAQRAPVPAQPAPATPRPDDTDAANAPDADANAPVSSGTPDSANSVRRDDTDDDSRADKAEQGDKDRRKDDTAASAAPALPFTAATLALAGGIAPIPTPALSVPTPAVPEQAANVNQAASALAPTAGASITANVSGLTPTVTPATTNAASAPLNTSASVSLNIPLDTPGVSMDSNAAGNTAASGVANASAPTPAQAPPAPLALPLPNAANAATLAAANAATTGATLPATQTAAISASAAPSPASVTNPNAPITAPAAGTATAATATLQAANTAQAVSSPSPSPAEIWQADALPAAPLVPGDTIAAPRSSKAASAVVALPLPGVSGAATITSLTTPSTTPFGAAPDGDGAGGTSPSDAVSKAQNLGGIERMLTLGAGKTGENSPGANAALAASVSETAGAASVNAALPVGEGRAAAAQRGGYAAHLPGANAAANAANPGTAAAPLNANPANADPMSAINPQADTPGVTGATSAIVPPLNSTVRMAEALQVSGKNSLTGPATLLAAAEPTPPGANTTASLLAVPDASGRSTGQDAASEQAQSDAQGRSQENTDGDNSTASLNGVVSAPATNAQASAGTGATATTGTSGPNGSSQLDRAQVVAQVTQHLEGMRLANGNGEMRVRLTPGHLGNVQISVASHQDGVVARIAVESAQIQQVMEGAKAHLRASLEARGLHVQSVEVTVTPHYNGGGQSAFGQPRGSESMGERMAERAAYGRASSASTPAPTDNAASIARAAPLARTAASRLDCQA